MCDHKKEASCGELRLVAVILGVYAPSNHFIGPSRIQLSRRGLGHFLIPLIAEFGVGVNEMTSGLENGDIARNRPEMHDWFELFTLLNIE